ncbi:hypothetical protein [Methanococcoides methylutens]|uniref:hypothetical protein n=1 Tax=Methanococcoides methylutens TaxID=2226 RepID=UPI0012E0142F|nr:hypothetical protein [Methanococcoides methylutens]
MLGSSPNNCKNTMSNEKKNPLQSRFVAEIVEGQIYDNPGPITDEDRKKAQKVWDTITDRK